MSNSSLVNYTRLSPNHSGKRTQSIYMIAPHCVVGQASVETIGAIFAPTSRQASSNYGIGSDGRVGMYVEECNRSWCTSSNWVDQRAVTIECASDATSPYAFNSKVYAKLVTLCVDICKRNGKSKLLWLETRAKTEAYQPSKNEMLLVVHRWYANKACPGDWLMWKMPELVKSVNAKLKSDEKETTTDDLSQYTDVQLAQMVIKGKFGNGEDRKKALGSRYAAVQAIVTQLMSSGVYYTVRGGDTVSKIAKKFNTSVELIAAMNPQIKDLNKIYVKQQIRVK